MKRFALISVVLICTLLSLNFQVFAKTWNVFPRMSRAEIQDKIDWAKDGDKIKFHKGTYDFSQEAIIGSYVNGGLFVIAEKSLTIIGKPGNLIIGLDSEKNGDGA